ncbi:MAG: ParB/RepB/Spo0J family partition protein [Verrucomicrobiae bacterium]|nr:ParB/RepB/Spo0J family partition protein [Verrucomicrobiae bacterium]
MSAKPLGRGLDALLGARTAGPPTLPAAEPGEAVRRIPRDKVVPCPLQPRKEFDEASLQELADSIRSRGIMQPLVVREREGQFELIAGERRWRAAKLAGLAEVPVLVRAVSDVEALELALIENLQRADLNPIEEAEGYANLQNRFKLTQEDISRVVGKPRATVANALRLLELDPTVKAFVSKGQLSAGHAKALLAVKDAPLQRALAERTIRQGLSVRQVEGIAAGLARGEGKGARHKKGGAKPADADIKDLQGRLRRRFTTQVSLKYSGGKGRIEIEFYSLDDLNRIADLMGVDES